MKSFGLIGKSLKHSFSKSYFETKFKNLELDHHRYELLEWDSVEQFKSFIDQDQDFIGFNVTIPYKTSIIAQLDRVDEAAQQINAVNTIRIERNGNKITSKGFNTDVIGFKETLMPYLSNKVLQSAMVLGTGGASKAVQYVLKSYDIPFVLISRTSDKGDFTYEELNQDHVQQYSLIVNTTPVGMFPHVDQYPDIPYEAINQHNVIIDLVYNPENTVFLQKGAKQGAQTENGLKMLHAQAEASWEIWNRKR